jgi:hypothetical protein
MVVRNWKVVDTAPYARRWTMGRDIRDLLKKKQKEVQKVWIAEEDLSQEKKMSRYHMWSGKEVVQDPGPHGKWDTSKVNFDYDDPDYEEPENLKFLSEVLTRLLKLKPGEAIILTRSLD